MRQHAIDAVIDFSSNRAKLLSDYHFRTLRRPMLGGAFGHGGFELGSYLSDAGGLHKVYYFALHTSSGAVLSFDDDKAHSIAHARMLLVALDSFELQHIYRAVAEQLAARQQVIESERLAARAVRIEQANSVVPIKTVPKRRRQVFEKSGGVCHYCSTALTLDGRWHIEHKMPRALLGGSEQDNLVASCVTCNMKKKDKTDLEFIESRKGAA